MPRRGSKVIVHPLKGGLEGGLWAPPSKSYTHRALIASAYAGGVTVVEDPLVSSDTLATVSLARAMGYRVSTRRGRLKLAGRGVRVRRPWCNCRGSGTTLRLGMGLASLGDRVFLLYGNGSLNRRPVGHLAEALTQLAVSVTTSGGTPPVSIRGPPRAVEGMVVWVEGSVSSQFVSSLLMLSGKVGFTVGVKGRLRSRPYIDLTLRVMEAFGVGFRLDDSRDATLFTPRGAYRSPGSYRVPGDYSSAAFPLAAGALGGRVRVWGLDPGDAQGDRLFLDLLERMGARVRRGEGWVEASSSGGLEAVDAYMGDAPDLVPILSVLASYARGVSRLRGVGHLRFKESDRIAGIVENLKSLGGEARVEDDGETLVVRGVGRLKGGRVDSRCDHRLVMSFAVGALWAEGPVEISCPQSVVESYPGFFEDFSRLGARLEWG